MSLQDKLDALKANLQTKVPADVHDVMKRATDALIASGQADTACKVGDKAPEFTLADANGTNVTLADLLATGPVVLTFYRGVWCPYCNMELQALQEALPAIEAHGARLIAITPQTAANSRKAGRTQALTFPILTDPMGEVAAAFGLRFTLPPELVEVYKGFGNDLTTVNADPQWRLPMPARYVIAQDGKIVYAEVSADYTQRPDPSEMMPALEAQAKIRANATA